MKRIKAINPNDVRQEATNPNDGRHNASAATPTTRRRDVDASIAALEAGAKDRRLPPATRVQAREAIQLMARAGTTRDRATARAALERIKAHDDVSEMMGLGEKKPCAHDATRFYLGGETPTETRRKLGKAG